MLHLFISFLYFFRFLYTGDVQFRTFGEAQDLYELASDYGVEELAQKCHTYMLQGNLTLANVFSRYEYALKIQQDILLKDCQNFVCSNVRKILDSDGFMNASPEVVEDIVKLDNLPLSNELEIITAVLNWGLKNLRKNEEPDDVTNLRKSIEPFFKHLRILSLTSAEFLCLVKEYNIFTAFETSLLTQKIMMPESNIKLPENLCCITSKRGSVIVSNITSTKYEQSHSVKSNSPMSVRSNPTTSSNPPTFRQSDNKKIGYEVRKYSSKNDNSPGFKQKFNSTPNIIREIQLPVPNFSQNLLRDFQFPLTRSDMSFKLSFQNDIKSWVVMKMKSGNLSLYGFELKVKNKNEKKEELEISVDLQGFSKQRFEKSYKMELRNDVLSIKFSKPMKLLEGTRGKLEVSIENLFLDRCSHISKKQYELNSGLNFECEFCIDSNKKTDDDGNFLFLISRLIYASC